MSRIGTPQTNQSNSPQLKIPHEKIAMRAYEKWVKRGRPHGSHDQDWNEAESELRNEFNRGNSGSTAPQAQPVQPAGRR